VPPTAVDIQNLNFAYGQQLVLKHVTLPVESGSTLGVVGPNGGGKTTLLRLLLGLHEPTRGSIRVLGLSPPAAVRRGDLIGYVPQAYSFASDFPLSVRQLARLGLVAKTGMLRAYSKGDKAFVDHLLDRVGVKELADRPVGSLSGGQRQRAMIARALAPKPKLLLLDEPTTGIDRAGQERFIQFLADLKREMDLTVILVSHDLQTVSALADRVACLNVTLHYHDTPDHLPMETLHHWLTCPAEAGGLIAPVDLGVPKRREPAIVTAPTPPSRPPAA
jgi:zinc transport system ATP-binding protein